MINNSKNNLRIIDIYFSFLLNKKLIALFSLGGFILSFIYALLLPTVWRASLQAVLKNTELSHFIVTF